MSERITFYYNPMSRGRVAHWMLEEVEADYEIKILDWKKADHKSPEYLAVNPMGKIPAIRHKGIVVTEVAAICAYLADIYPSAKLAPLITNPLRGSYYRWMFFAASCIEPAMLDKTHPRSNDPKASMMGHGSYNDVFSTLETALEKGFLLGDHFSAADLYTSSQLEWGIFSKTIEAKKSYMQYIQRCQDRPGYRRYIEQVGPIA